jgi:hypothetical protein
MKNSASLPGAKAVKDGAGETRPRRYGRRALVLGAAAAGAGMTVDLVTGGAPARAATDDTPVLLGESNTSTNSTYIYSSDGVGLLGDTVADNASGLTGSDRSSSGGVGVFGVSDNGVGVDGHTSGSGQSGVKGLDESTGGGYGVYATSLFGTGVYGASTESTGIFGQSSAGGQAGVIGTDLSTAGGYGVQGNSDYGFGVQGTSTHSTGVFGQTLGEGQIGVVGEDLSNGGGGYGLWGASNFGVGVHAYSDLGPALEVDGPAKFSRSGIATVDGTKSSGKSSVTVKGVKLAETSMVLATLQSHLGGTGIAAAVPDVKAGSFTIYLTAEVRDPARIAWLVLD